MRQIGISLPYMSKIMLNFATDLETTITTTIMNEEQILSAVESLSHSQGFYGRVLEHLNENKEALSYLAKQNFGDVVDLVMFLEC
jgi:hypothetical protein